MVKVVQVLFTLLLMLKKVCNFLGFGMEEDVVIIESSFNKIEQFGYKFNEEGKLRSMEDGEPYQFKRYDDHRSNQKAYEALGEVITDFVYKELEETLKLKRVYIDLHCNDKEPMSFFFMSEDALMKERLMLLVHGSGVVRAGQWARKLIINESLEKGTQFPYIQWGLQNDFGVIVANPNLNYVLQDNEKVKIKGSSTPEDHMETLWEKYVSTTKATAIVIVAHSYGGISTLQLAVDNEEDFQRKVRAIALTDSVHSLAEISVPDSVKDLYRKRACNWASSHDELDHPLDKTVDFCPTVSAGTDVHEYTSYSCMKSVFKFISEKLDFTQVEGEGTETCSAGSNHEDCEQAAGATNFVSSQELRDCGEQFSHSDVNDEKNSRQVCDGEEEKNKEEIVEPSCKDADP